MLLRKDVGGFVDQVLGTELDAAWRQACADVVASVLSRNLRVYGAELASRLSPKLLLECVLQARGMARGYYADLPAHDRGCRCRQESLVMAAAWMTRSDMDEAICRINEYLDERN